MTRNVICRTCRFFDQWERSRADKGECRLARPVFPPVQEPELGPRDGVWPKVHGGDWCGEWKAVDVEETHDLRNGHSESRLGFKEAR